MNSSRHPVIERFVRDTLGCQCADEVFQSIEYAPGPRIGNVQVLERLVIGGKLLIYIVLESELSSLDASVRDILMTGLSDREKHCLNRFRLVIGSADPGQIRTIAEGCLSSFESRDERIHLHIVDSSGLP